MKRRKGFYSISIVAKMFSVHQQTIRMYEKEGLIAPNRTEGNTRLFSEEDVDRLEQVIHLTHKMGVNLAGVQMILKLQKKIKRLQGDMNKLFEQASGQLEEESNRYKDIIEKQGEKLFEIKDKTIKKEFIDIKSSVDEKREKEEKINNENDNNQSQSDYIDDDWEIDYSQNE